MSAVPFWGPPVRSQKTADPDDCIQLGGRKRHDEAAEALHGGRVAPAGQGLTKTLLF